jgi:hypothetical protein
MTLHLFFPTCLVCNRGLAESRDEANLDRMDEDGRRQFNWCYALPQAHIRDKMAPFLCDLCWQEHRSWHCRLSYGRNGNGSVPPFHQIYLWAWVVERIGKTAQRLPPHYSRHAQRGYMVLDRSHARMRA